MISSHELIPLLHKYNKEGPRYTSYPTAPCWSENFTNVQYAEHLAHLCQDHEKVLSVYVHIPFCRRLCLYCGCSMIVDSTRRHVTKYLHYLARELDLFSSHYGYKPLVAQMHWGGGTPTFLNEDEITFLYEQLKNSFTFEKDAEIAIEIDPAVTSFAQLTLLHKLGFNRLSMGVQDFDPRVQEIVKRKQSLSQTLDVIRYARDLSFSSINIDLMYGLPLQTVENFRFTVEEILKIAPERIAAFSYAKVPWIKAHQKRLPDELLPAPEEKLRIFCMARDAFLDAGYLQIGMDHFAKGTDELARALSRKTLHRNFMGYTVKYTADSVGFGVSAIGYLNSSYAQNIKSLPEYYAALDKDTFPTLRGLTLNADDRVRQWVIYALMCQFEVRYKSFEQRFHTSFEQYFSREVCRLEDFARDGCLTITQDAIKILPLGMLFIRNIAMVFDVYLLKEARGQFSKTV